MMMAAETVVVDDDRRGVVALDLDGTLVATCHCACPLAEVEQDVAVADFRIVYDAQRESYLYQRRRGLATFLRRLRAAASRVRTVVWTANPHAHAVRLVACIVAAADDAHEMLRDAPLFTERHCTPVRDGLMSTATAAIKDLAVLRRAFPGADGVVLVDDTEHHARFGDQRDDVLLIEQAQWRDADSNDEDDDDELERIWRCIALRFGIEDGP